jgi:hypothetical protein
LLGEISCYHGVLISNPGNNNSLLVCNRFANKYIQYNWMAPHAVGRFVYLLCKKFCL